MILSYSPIYHALADQIEMGPHGKHQLSNKKIHQNRFTHPKIVSSKLGPKFLIDEDRIAKLIVTLRS